MTSTASVLLSISIANPQSALSTASLFAAILPPTASLGLGLGAIGIMAGIAIIW